jgi:hypothetical protein
VWFGKDASQESQALLMLAAPRFFVGIILGLAYFEARPTVRQHRTFDTANPSGPHPCNKHNDTDSPKVAINRALETQIPAITKASTQNLPYPIMCEQFVPRYISALLLATIITIGGEIPS